MSKKTQSIRSLLILIFFLLPAFGLRIYNLDTQPLTGDEAFSLVNWPHASLDYLFNTLAVIDPQPPVALLSFFAWIHLIGETEFAARMLSVLANTITVALAYAIARRLSNKATGLIAMFFFAINPYQIWHAQDLRTYSLWMFSSAMATYALLSVTKKNSTVKWILYIAASALSLYTYYLEAFILIAHNIYLAHSTYQRNIKLKHWIFSQLAIILTLTPWFLRSEIRNNNYQPTASTPNILEAIQTLSFGNTLPIPNIAYISLGFIVISLISTWMTKPKPTSLLLTSLIIIPPGLLTILTLITNKGYFRPRYISASSLPITLALAMLIQSIGASRQTHQLAKRTVTLAMTTIITCLSLLSLIHYYYDPQFAKAPNWREVVQVLNNQTTITDLLIFNYPDPALAYYFKGPAEYVILPTKANPPQEEADITISSLAKQYSHIWFIPVYVQSWDGKQTIAQALNNQTQHLSEQQIGQTRLYQYASWHVQPEHIAVQTNIPYGDLAILKGYRLTPSHPSFTPDSDIHLEIFWQPKATHTENLTVFSHLIGPNQTNGSPLWAQDDYPPQDGQTTTRHWTPQILIRDTYTLKIPINAIPGKYAITIGLYNPQTNERFALSQNIPQAEPDGATLLTFTIQ